MAPLVPRFHLFEIDDQTWYVLRLQAPPAPELRQPQCPSSTLELQLPEPGASSFRILDRHAIAIPTSTVLIKYQVSRLSSCSRPRWPYTRLALQHASPIPISRESQRPSLDQAAQHVSTRLYLYRFLCWRWWTHALDSSYRQRAPSVSRIGPCSLYPYRLAPKCRGMGTSCTEESAVDVRAQLCRCGVCSGVSCQEGRWNEAFQTIQPGVSSL